MATSFQGASGLGGQTRLYPSLVRPVSGNHAAPEPVLTRLEQISQEEPISNQIWKLTVRLLVNALDPSVDDTPRCPSLPLTSS